ncbi:MAG: type I polyketide synthase, partial [Solirubrobacterales bacterium]
LSFSDPKLAIVSNVSGETLTTEQATDPAYWVRHVREPVRFADAISTLQKQGTSTYLELGPDPVLCAMARECLGEEPDLAAFVPTLREGREEAGAVSTAIAGAHAAGAKVDWERFFEGTGAKRVSLPTYPFQRRHYWIGPSAGTADAGAMGLAAAEHPLLGAAVELAGGDGEGLVLTGRFSASTHSWLADHVVGETILLSGSTFVELALRAAEQAGAETIEELVLLEPRALSEIGAVAIQVSVAGAGENGRREIAIHSRREDEDAAWVLNARGTLSDRPVPPPEPPDPWPPESAEPIEVEYIYDLLAEHGLDYGPAFQGLSAAWRDGERIYAEVWLPEEHAHDVERFGIHPALLDAVLHPTRLAGIEERGEGPSLPSSWRGISLAAVGARGLRATITPDGDGGVSMQVADSAGAPVLAVAGMVSAPVDPSRLRDAGQRRQGLLAIDWTEIALPTREMAADEVELLRCPIEADLATAEAARKATRDVLGAIQGWLADESKANSRLALITVGAMSTGNESADPAAAAIWGLVRSAQSEHPGRFALVDTDGSDASEAALPGALALGAEEPQLALREGAALAPRLVRAPGMEMPEEGTLAIDPERTILITGATGGLGSLVARHLAERHGARRLLLISRRGREAEGAAELAAEIEGLGAEARIEACDAADPAALKALLASIPAEHPLGAVVHCAGAIDDGTVETLGAEQVERVFVPKADGAWNLHELTRDVDLSAFVLFSSAAGTLGGAGQANYAAANVFLDALAQRRRAEGLTATSIDWGLWQRGGGMISQLSEADLARMRRAGFEALADEQGLDLFDAAIDSGRAQALAIPLNLPGLRALAAAGALPPIFGGLVRTHRRSAAASASLAAELAKLPEAEHESHVLDLVRAQVAAMLGHASPGDVEPARAFQELGFDSLAAVELRNRLDALTGLRLPPTAVFDHPSSAALAGHLLAEVLAKDGGMMAAESKEAEIREVLASIPLARLRRAGLIDPLLQLTDAAAEAEAEAEPDDGDSIDSMGVEELIRKSAEGTPTEPGEGAS